MNRKRKWNGYRSYSYLDPGDYRQFEFVPEIGRVEDASMTWPSEIEERARQVIDANIVASFHDHISVHPSDPQDFLPYRLAGREVTPYEALAAGELDLAFDGGNAYVTMIRSHTPWDWDDVVMGMAMRRCDWDHQDFVTVVTRKGELTDLRGSGRFGVILTLECADPVGNDLDRIDGLFGMGLRSMGLVYNESNLVGGGLADNGSAGLTRFGQRVVRRMNQLGLLIDISHCNDQTSLEALEASTAPVVISHAGARALWDIPRMKPDEVLKACADTGGVIGIEAAPHTTITYNHRRHDIDSVMEHLEYCVDLVGIDHVAFGADTHYGDHVAWHKHFQTTFGGMRRGAPRHDEVDFVRGCENPTESTSNMIRWMIAHGYSDEDVAKVMGGNIVRVLEQIWPC